MKPVTPSLLVLLALSFCSATASAQSTINIGANLSAGRKGFYPNTKLGLGTSLEYIKMISKNGALRAYTAYDWFKYRQPGNIDPQRLSDSLRLFPFAFSNRSVIPLRIGYQHFFYKNAAFVYGEAGVARLLGSKIYDPGYGFTYALGTGYRIALTEQQYLQFSLFYNQNFDSDHVYGIIKSGRNINYFSFRAAYGLNFKTKATK